MTPIRFTITDGCTLHCGLCPLEARGGWGCSHAGLDPCTAMDCCAMVVLDPLSLPRGCPTRGLPCAPARRLRRVSRPDISPV